MSVADQYLAASLAGSRKDAWHATRAARDAGWTTEAIYRDQLAWSQRRIGELWLRSEITVSQEHMASAVTQCVIARLYPELDSPRDRGRIVVAALENELHTLPAQLAADLLELAGFDVTFLGTHVPADHLLAALDADPPDVLGLSATMVPSLTQTLAFIDRLRRTHPRLPVVVGGHALEMVGRLPELDRVWFDRGDLHALQEVAPG